MGLSKAQIIGLVLLCFIVFIGIEVVAIRILTTENETGGITAKPEPQTVETETGEEVVITRIGTSSIKKLDLEKGSIYFTDGWAVYIKQGE